MSSWRDPLERWLRQHAAALGLRADHLKITPLVNPSGWLANVACTVSDGQAPPVHVKLSSHAREQVTRTYQLREHLRRHHAPPVLALIDLGDLVGTVTPSINGAAPTDAQLPALVAAADALHADRALARALPDHPPTLGQAFRDLWIERFASDLAELQTDDLVPPFVAPQTLTWMHSETTRLAEATAAPLFEVPTESATHNDLHLDNVLVETAPTSDDAFATAGPTATRRFWIIDWDDIRRGDPAADLAILLSGPLLRGDPIEPLLGPRDPAFLQRFALCARAVLLDDIIDSLADWAHADDAPAAADTIRATKRATHDRALFLYRHRYSAT
jgi:thiamine kinase-like enzyme